MDWGAIFGNAAVELISPTTAAYALAALGLAIHFGFTGLLNFGQAGFMLLGAYGYAIPALKLGWPVWACVLTALAASVIFALILGIPTLRLRADYLAIVNAYNAAEGFPNRLQATYVTLPIAGSELVAAICRTVLQAGPVLEPVRAPFERRMRERRIDPGRLVIERRHLERRRDPAQALRHVSGFRRVRPQEPRELALRQQHDLEELLVRHAQHVLDRARHVVDAGDALAVPALEPGQRALRGLADGGGRALRRGCGRRA